MKIASRVIERIMEVFIEIRELGKRGRGGGYGPGELVELSRCSCAQRYLHEHSNRQQRTITALKKISFINKNKTTTKQKNSCAAVTLKIIRG